MNIIQQLFLQTILVGAFFGSLAGFVIVSIVKGLFELVKILIKKLKEME